MAIHLAGKQTACGAGRPLGEMAAVHYLSTVKITTEIRNVGDTAYAMRRAAAEACTQQLAAGRGRGYWLGARSLQSECGTDSGPAW